jgi:UDP-GlcNAc3NAcA epimerase
VAGAGGEALRTVSVVGARPQFVKLAPVARAMAESPRPVTDLIVHTGQHYDDSMSRVFFEELGIPHPAINLGVGSGSQGRQTARMLEAIEGYLLEVQPDAVVVYGDTNSTLAGALAAAKLHIPLAHVEAGLRSFNRRMPEELNRIVTDHLSQRLFAPTQTAMDNLAVEGLGERAQLTGDVMYDAVLHSARAAAQRSHILQTLRLAPGECGVATLHRAENTAPQELRALLEALNEAATHFARIVFPMHPRTAAVVRDAVADWQAAPQLQIVEPLGYLDMLALVQAARWVLTDSGGLQKEAYFLARPCITLRNETEWLETLEQGANSIAGSDGARLMQLLEKCDSRGSEPAAAPSPRAGPFGDGRAAQRIVEALCDLCELPK